MPLDDAFALAGNDQLVGCDVFEGFGGTLRPADADVRPGARTQPEMDAKIALRYVVPAAANFVDLLSVPERRRDASTDRVPTGRRQRPYQQRVAARAEVFQQRWGLEEVDDFEGKTFFRRSARRALRIVASKRKHLMQMAIFEK